MTENEWYDFLESGKKTTKSQRKEFASIAVENTYDGVVDDKGYTGVTSFVPIMGKTYSIKWMFNCIVGREDLYPHDITC